MKGRLQKGAENLSPLVPDVRTLGATMQTVGHGVYCFEVHPPLNVVVLSHCLTLYTSHRIQSG